MKPLNDYSNIRGVCYGFRGDDQAQFERELGWAKKIGVNSVRFWMNQGEFEKDPQSFLRRQRNFMETCWKFGISSMPIFWNGNSIREFSEPAEEDYEKAFAYAKAFIDEFRGEEYLLMWDVMNEPFCNDFMRKCKPEEYDEHYAMLRKYLRRLCAIVRELDPEGCLTVGHERVFHIESTEDLVDVSSFHDYLTTRSEIEDTILKAEEIGRRLNKPILNTETGCVGRSNPYDIEIELSQKHGVGFYLFSLMIGGFWGELHGIFYPDGTIRDPSIVAAMLGFFRNRTADRVLTNPNREGYAYNAVKKVEEALHFSESALFVVKQGSAQELLEAAERCVNILEAAEMVPMWDLPSAKIESWRRLPPEQLDIWEIRRFTYEMAQLLKEKCLIL